MEVKTFHYNSKGSTKILHQPFSKNPHFHESTVNWLLQLQQGLFLILGCKPVSVSDYLRPETRGVIYCEAPTLSFLCCAPRLLLDPFHCFKSSASSCVTPTFCISAFISPILLCHHHLLLLSRSSIFNNLCPIYPLSLLWTCPNHFSHASLTLSPHYYTLQSCASGIFFSTPVHPGHFQFKS